MYVRCLIVILVVALAEIFPTGIEACMDVPQGSDTSFGDLPTCYRDCCPFCLNVRGKRKCKCTEVKLFVTTKIQCICKR